MDDTLEDDMEFRSNALDAAWWEPTGARAIVVLGNSSPVTIHAIIEYGSGTSERVEIAPHATVLRQVPTAEIQSVNGDGHLGSAHVTFDGMPGGLRVSGFTSSMGDRYLSTVRFFDPGLSTEPALFANGLHFSGASNHLLVKNASQSTILVKGTLFPIDFPASVKARPLPIKEILAGAVEELNLPEPNAALDGAAIKLESSGGAGSIVAAFTSFDPQRQIARTMPFKDATTTPTGGYPWRLDGDFTSRVFITNVGSVRAAFGAIVRPKGSKPYIINTRNLEVGETALIDIKEIRDAQIPDPHDVRLPKNAVAGQFEWSTLFGDGSQRMIGRAEVVSLSGRSASSFSCAGCCSFSTTNATLIPSGPAVGIGSVTNLEVLADQNNFCGTQQTFDIIPSSWVIADPTKFSVSTGTTAPKMTGKVVGTSNFYTPFNGTIILPTDQFGRCQVVSTPIINPGGPGCTATLAFSGTAPSFVFVGTDPQLLSANTYFLTASLTGGTYSGSSSNASDTLTFAAVSGLEKVQIKTTTQSVSLNDRILTFNYTPQSCTTPVTLKKNVTARQFAYATNGALGNICSLGHGYKYDITYSVFTHPDNAVVPPGVGLGGTVAAETISPAASSCGTSVNGNGSLDDNSQFTDRISLCSANPIPACSSTHTQTLSVAGSVIRTNKLTFTDQTLTYVNQGPTQ